MTRSDALLRASLASISLLALSACATPYPTRYTGGAGLGPAPSPATACSDALKEPSKQDKVQSCLETRAAGWEGRAAFSRRITRNAGAFTVLAAAVGIGLAAEGDPNHAVVPLGLATGAAVTGAGSFASPDQAGVAEKAVAAYNCLISAVAEWKAGDNTAAIDEAYKQLVADVTAGETELNGVAFSSYSAATTTSLAAQRAAELKALEAAHAAAKSKDKWKYEELEARLKAYGARYDDASARIEAARDSFSGVSSTAAVAHAQVMSQAGLPGARLLRQSDEVDRVAIGEITKRELTVYSISATARQSIQAVAAQVQSAAPAAKDVAAESPDAAKAAGAADPCGKSGTLARWCGVVDAWSARATRAEADAARAAVLTSRAKRNAERFDAEVKANKAQDPTLGQNCAVAVTNIPPLTASAAAITLDKSGAGSLVLRGGVGGYFAEQPPSGWTVTLSPSGRTAARVDVKAPSGASGTQTLTFYDGGESPSSVSVDVKVADAAAAASGSGGDQPHAGQAPPPAAGAPAAGAHAAEAPAPGATQH